MVAASRVVHEITADGSIHSLVLEGPKGNIIDEAMCHEVLAALEGAARVREGKLLVISGAAGNFSYGASVQEHFPEQAPRMLANMRAVIEAIWGFPYPTLAAIEGRCLGGGLEVALACSLIFVDETATLAFPEIRLGSFPPFGTALLAGRLPRPLVTELLLTGRELTPAEALEWGVANRVIPHGKMEDAVFDFSKKQILPFSASCLRVACRAITKLGSMPHASMSQRLMQMETHYLEELVPLEDAGEGIRAFLEKRYPGWRNR
jgi:cyclohexa-1,5-dienecarbonyl-CoA hydratase